MEGKECVAEIILTISETLTTVLMNACASSGREDEDQVCGLARIPASVSRSIAVICSARERSEINSVWYLTGMVDGRSFDLESVVLKLLCEPILLYDPLGEADALTSSANLSQTVNAISVAVSITSRRSSSYSVAEAGVGGRTSTDNLRKGPGPAASDPAEDDA